LLNDFLDAKKTTNGIDEYTKELLESYKKFKGGMFGIDVALNGGFGNVTAFESHISEQNGDAETQCRYDLMVGDNYIETKNWSSLHYMLSENKDGVNTFLKQFKAYLGEIGSLSELKYVFKQRSGVSETTAKNKFQQLFRGSSKTDNDGNIIYGYEIFVDLIKTNPNLLKSLGFLDDDFDDDKRNQFLAKCKALVDGSLLYNFITVR
jgi:hypothetical protein